MLALPRHCGVGECHNLAAFNVLTVTFPVFALVLYRLVAARRGLLLLQAILGLNGFVLFFALPCMLYRFGASAPTAQLLNASVAMTDLLCAGLRFLYAGPAPYGGRSGPAQCGIWHFACALGDQRRGARRGVIWAAAAREVVLNRQRVHINRPAHDAFAFRVLAGGMQHRLPAA